MKTKLDKEIEDTYKSILGMVGLVCMLFWWVPLFISIGSLIIGEYTNSVLSFLLTLLMLVLWKGSELAVSKDEVDI